MPQQQVPYLNFAKGLLTEANPLNFPPQFTEDELNCVVTDKSGRAPRFAFSNITDATVHQYSAAQLAIFNRYADGTTIPTGQHADLYNEFVWDSPGEDSNLKFLCVQDNNFIKFFDISTFDKVTAINSFAINIQKYLINSNINVQKQVEFFQGKNALFICSPEMESIYVEYKANFFGRFIIATIVDIKVRDFDQFTVPNDLDDEPVNPSQEFIYNLKNQGWVPAIEASQDPIQQYREGFSKYPSLSMQWWVSKKFDTSPPDVQRFSPNGLRAEFFGNAQAPKGHYIYSAFNFDRANKSGLSVANTRKSKRALTGTFAFGRAFWSDGQLIYFSQTIESNIDVAGNCFQSGDPTAEYFNEIVDTDGGVISIIEANNIKKLLSVQNGLIVFAENGVWAVQGGDGDVFKPNSYRVYQVTTDGVVQNNALAIINDQPIWASEHSINQLIQNQTDLRFQAQSLTEETIKTFYISEVVNKQSIKIFYDRLDDKVYIGYNNDTTLLNKFITHFLILDTRASSWHPWEIDAQTNEDVFQVIKGAFVTDQTGIQTNLENVATDGANICVNGIQVVSKGSKSITNITTSITFITENNADEFRFGRFQDSSYLDYGTQEYSAFFKTGPLTSITLSEDKNIKYLTAYFKESLGNDACNILVFPDFVDNPNADEVAGPFNAYKSKGNKKNVNKTRLNIPGQAEFFNIKFNAETGKGFEFYGCTIDWSTERNK